MDGLAAAILLARSGLETIVLERGAETGGRCATWQFAPGFFASPFVDDVPRIPAALAERLGLAGELAEDQAADGRILFRRDAILARVHREAQMAVPHTIWEKLQAHM